MLWASPSLAQSRDVMDTMLGAWENEDPRLSLWIGDLRRRAIDAGVRAETFDELMAGFVPDPKVIDRDQGQPEGAKVPVTFGSYRSKIMTPLRVERGRVMMERHRLALSRIEREEGVPSSIILAIWGIETAYGSFRGSFDIIGSLATLAHDGRRRELFTNELIVAMQMIDQGQVSREALRGSWAGASGHPQFLPTSYRAYAKDGDGDGRADIWGSEADAFRSIAAYLRANGWRPGFGVAALARAPSYFDRRGIEAVEKNYACKALNRSHSRPLALAEWRRRGLLFDLPGANEASEATLVEPEGAGGTAYLALGNYRAVLRYNCSNPYALTVSDLAKRIAR